MALFSRACDECRRRKVRCDAGDPCSNCRIASLACQFRVLPKKRGRRPRSNRSLTPVLPCRNRQTAHGPCPASPQTEDGTLVTSIDSPYHQFDHCHQEQDQAQHPVSSPAVLGSPQDVVAHRVRVQHTQSTQPGLSNIYAQSPSQSLSPRGDVLCTNAGEAFSIRRKLFLELNEILCSDRLGQPLIQGETRSGNVDRDHTPDTVLRVMHKCIDVFFQYFFPNTPIAHEPSLRLAVVDFASSSGLYPPSPTDTTESDHLASMRGFAMITSLCAFVTSVVPDSVIAHSIALTWPFYTASRAMLRLFEEVDLDSPVSSSYTSRIWQASALQNLTGKNAVAWHVSGEITVMALRTRLYDEDTLGKALNLESQLLRANFWLIYLSDRTATAFEGRPSVMSDILTHGLLTLRDRPSHSQPLLDPSNTMNRGPFEEVLIQGFHLKTRLWATAAEFIHHLKIFSKQHQPIQTQCLPELQGWGKLVDAHGNFLSTLDDLPTCLRSPNSACSGLSSDTVADYQAQSFWALRNNTISVYHCMRLIILHECVQQGIPEVLGLENQEESLAVRKLEIVQDFLLEMQLVPFMCLKVQGEAGIQRIRRVGCILLEMVNHAVNGILHKRATSQFHQVLDILTSLDSKATATELGAGIVSADASNIEL